MRWRFWNLDCRCYFPASPMPEIVFGVPDYWLCMPYCTHLNTTAVSNSPAHASPTHNACKHRKPLPIMVMGFAGTGGMHAKIVRETTEGGRGRKPTLVWVWLWSRLTSPPPTTADTM